MPTLRHSATPLRARYCGFDTAAATLLPCFRCCRDAALRYAFDAVFHYHDAPDERMRVPLLMRRALFCHVSPLYAPSNIRHGDAILFADAASSAYASAMITFAFSYVMLFRCCLRYALRRAVHLRRHG